MSDKDNLVLNVAAGGGVVSYRAELLGDIARLEAACARGYDELSLDALEAAYNELCMLDEICGDGVSYER